MQHFVTEAKDPALVEAFLTLIRDVVAVIATDDTLHEATRRNLAERVAKALMTAV